VPTPQPYTDGYSTAMKTQRPKAFTFVEVIAALAVVAIALTGLLHMNLLSAKTADVAQATEQAVFLARSKMTEALCEESAQAAGRSGTTEINGSRFTWRTERTSVDVPQLRGLRRGALQQLNVNVTWQQGNGHKHVQMTTYVADTAIHE